MFSFTVALSWIICKWFLNFIDSSCALNFRLVNYRQLHTYYLLGEVSLVIRWQLFLAQGNMPFQLSTTPCIFVPGESISSNHLALFLAHQGHMRLHSLLVVWTEERLPGMFTPVLMFLPMPQ